MTFSFYVTESGESPNKVEKQNQLDTSSFIPKRINDCKVFVIYRRFPTVNGAKETPRQEEIGGIR